MALLPLILLFTPFTWGQLNIYGLVKSDIGATLPYVQVHAISQNSNKVHHAISDEFGRFGIEDMDSGEYILRATCLYHSTTETTVTVENEDIFVKMVLEDTAQLETVDVYYDSPYSTHNMRMVEGVMVTNGKKTQKIDLGKTTANKGRENARELFAKVPGLNIWESDGGGLQLGIGARGLSPSRTAHFNTRQNGYDISADALGYPETYYTPPAQALSSIQLIRGAASLQFGPQFGGMINFKIKDPSKQPIHYEGAHTYGSFNLINTFNLLSGTILKKRLSYMVYAQYKTGDGWRENSGFNQLNAFGKLTYRFSDDIFISLEQTHMNYLAQQAGGLTDALFGLDPRQSIRDRNWFSVDWNITASHFNWQINRTSNIDIKGFRVKANRLALGNLERISRFDDGKERTLIQGDFANYGGEARYLTRYPIGKKMLGITAAGLRYYNGQTRSRQGKADAGSDANFEFLNPTNLEGSDYLFPSQNAAAFMENILRINKKLSVSAGARYEFIYTQAEGNYREQVFHPLTEELIYDTTYTEAKSNQRGIVLGGLGFSYRADKTTEVYGNIAQNYRGINFSDIRIINPNQVVDPEISDERGYNADLGIRGQRKRGFFDFSVFFMHYNNKIGVINKKISEFDVVRFRTNVGRAYSAGIELFAEHEFKKIDSATTFFTVFGNFSAVYARYGQYEESALNNNRVELVPPLSGKIGLKFNHGKWEESLLGTYVHRHYSDGTNAVSDPNAIAGIIPTYFVIDLSGSYHFNDALRIAAGANNLTNQMYFTRRATAYPGPGIIPADGINFYLTINVSL
ncbi:MAG: TonB-dependent receptor domain-containing protein [Crocinitomicaceae bacterium]